MARTGKSVLRQGLVVTKEAVAGVASTNDDVLRVSELKRG